ncbi:MAG: DUF3185 family protein [Phycisphaeraceae bacterium]|nr:DUF3185 family protein [Phycisphaeraceae bacterium]
MQPQRIVGIALLIIGAILLIMGLQAFDSFGSQVSEFFTGSPTDRAVWMTIGGIAAIAVGIASTLVPSRAGRQ